MRRALDLSDVQIFASAARAGSLSAAAKELGLPTSTVSRSLTRLEKHLGLLLNFPPYAARSRIPQFPLILARIDA
jgi:hypothetical protein